MKKTYFPSNSTLEETVLIAVKKLGGTADVPAINQEVFMPIYRISKEYYANFCDHQREELLSEFDLDKNGDILIPYEHKGYICNDLVVESSRGIKAVHPFLPSWTVIATTGSF